MNNNKTCAAILAALILPLSIPAVHAADTWPSKTITIIVPSSAGGGTDLTGRLFAEGLSHELKQSVVVDNRPGAANNIGAAAAAHAPGDGYTFLVTANSSISINAYLYKDLSYNAETDLRPVARGVLTPLLWVVPGNSPYKTLAQMLEAGKKEPGKLSFGSSGFGTPPDMAVKMIEEKSGASFTHVPYKGVAASMADFLGGRLAFIIAVPDVVKAQIESGKARALATSVKLPLFPDVPAWTDLGLPEVPQSFSVMAPATTPDAIVEAMNRALMKVMQEPGVKRRIQDMGYVPVFDTPAEFAKDLKEERVMWKGVIERNHITVE